MILHGKDLIVSIDGNANMASKSCTLDISAKSIVKTSPTSGDWEEVLSGKKSWSLTTNHLVKASETAIPETISSITAFEVRNTLSEGWHARGECRMPPMPDTNYIFDEVGMDEGIDVLRIDSTTCQLLENHQFSKNATGLNEYLNGNTIGNGDLLIIMSNGEFVLPADVVSTLSVTYHTALPFIEIGRVSQFGNTYDTIPIIIACGKNIPQGYTAMNSVSNDVKFQLVNGTNFILDGIPGAINMVGKKVTIRMTDKHGSYIVGQAIVKQFKVTGTKGNLMAGSFAFTGNGELQINKVQDMPEDREIIDNVNRIIIDMTKSNPAEMVTGDINGPIFQEIFNSIGRYLFKYDRSGRAYICKLSNDNCSFFYDGTQALLNGSMGDVYVKIDAYFWYRIVQVGYKKISFEVCTNSHIQLGSEWHRWQDEERLIAAFQMTATKLWDNNIPADPSEEPFYPRSINIASPSTPISYAEPIFGNGTVNQNYFGIVGPEENTLIALLYLARYGKPNSQATCGKGRPADWPIGWSSGTSMEDTNVMSDNVKVFGLEGWWGGNAEWMERIKVTGNTWSIRPLNSLATITTISNANGDIKEMEFIPDHLIMIPSAAVNDEFYQEGFCDAVEWESGLEENPVLRGSDPTINGTAASFAPVGIFYLNAKSNIHGSGHTTVRLCFNCRNATLVRDVPSTFITREIGNPAN